MKRRRRMAKAYNCDTHGTHTKVMCPKCLDAGARKMAEVVLAMKDELLTEVVTNERWKTAGSVYNDRARPTRCLWRSHNDVTLVYHR